MYRPVGLASVPNFGLTFSSPPLKRRRQEGPQPGAQGTQPGDSPFSGLGELQDTPFTPSSGEEPRNLPSYMNRSEPTEPSRTIDIWQGLIRPTEGELLLAMGDDSDPPVGDDQDDVSSPMEVENWWPTPPSVFLEPETEQGSDDFFLPDSLSPSVRPWPEPEPVKEEEFVVERTVRKEPLFDGFSRLVGQMVGIGVDVLRHKLSSRTRKLAECDLYPDAKKAPLSGVACSEVRKDHSEQERSRSTRPLDPHPREKELLVSPGPRYRGILYDYEVEDEEFHRDLTMVGLSRHLMPRFKFTPLNLDTFTVKGCPRCVPPSWISIFKLRDSSSVGYCGHFERRLVKYSDLSLPRAVHIEGSFLNFIVVNVAETPNHNRVETVVDTVAKLSGGYVPPMGRAARFVLDCLNLDDCYHPRHRFGNLTVDLSYMAWFDKLGCCASSDAFRNNLNKSVLAGIEPSLWAQSVTDLAICYSVYYHNLNLVSSSLKRNEWAQPYLLDFVPRRNWSLGPLRHFVEELNPVFQERVAQNILNDVLRAGDNAPSVGPSSDSSESSSTESSDSESPHSEGGGTQESDSPFKEFRVGAPSEKKKPTQDPKVLKELEESVQVEEESKNFHKCTIRSYDDATEETTFSPFKSDLPTIPGQHVWKNEVLVPKIHEGIVITQVKDHELKAKEQSGVLFGQTFEADLFHYPSDGINQAIATAGRQGAEKPKVSATVKKGGLTFKRIPESHLELPASFNAPGDFNNLDDFLDSAPLAPEEGGDGRQDIEVLIKAMGKPSSRAKMLKLLKAVTSCEVNWSEQEKSFKVFVKADDKVGKLKARLIQYVPSSAWLKTIRRLNAVLEGLKGKEGGYGVWFDQKSRNMYVWASGMSQKRLSDLADRARGSPFNWVFICGDDNTDKFGQADASKYDSTQRGVFADMQWKIMSNLGFPDSEIKYMREYHTGNRFADAFTYVQVDEALPTGAPWTLFLNSIGTFIFAQQLSYCRNLAKTKKSKLSQEELVAIAAELLGLEMKFDVAEPVEGEDFQGAEFLKGVWVKGKRSYWVPLPSRLHKWSARIYAGDKELGYWMTHMDEHLRSVAKGQSGFILDPLSRIWVDAWCAKADVKTHKMAYEWKNVLYSSKFALEPEDADNWVKLWEPIMERRYGIDAETYAAMRKDLEKNATTLGAFGGRAWLAIWNRDYLGSVEGV